ncbi:MAG TPA: CatB-related O-acetyltransferase [Mucilaginibacter sp.]
MLNAITILFKDLKAYLSDVMRLAKNKRRYPDCRFYKGSVLLNSELGNFNVLFTGAQVINSTLGSHTYVQKRSTIVNASVGKFCSIASDVSIGPGNHKLDGVSTHPAFYLRNTPLLKKYSAADIFLESSKKTTVGHDVWIGEKAIVLDGLSIGTGAVIAAGAVVAKDVAPYSIVGGVPAKVIRMRFTEAEIELLLKSEWWNKDEDWLQQNYRAFDSIKAFKNLPG